MSKITVTGKAAVLTSSIKWDELLLVKKHRPDELTLWDKEAETPLFVIKTLPAGFGATGELCECGVMFEGPSNDEEGKATATLILQGLTPGMDPKEYIAEMYGTGLIYLNKMEEYLPSVIEEIKAEKKKVMEGIKLA